MGGFWGRGGARGPRGEGQGARGEGQGQGARALFTSLLPVLPRTALLPQPHPRQSALLGPIRIEKLSLYRILPEGLRSSVGLLSRLWRGVLGVFGVPLPPPPFFCERLFADL